MLTYALILSGTTIVLALVVMGVLLNSTVLMRSALGVFLVALVGTAVSVVIEIASPMTV